MKLVHQSFKYLSISILGVVAVWAFIFYVDMLNEIKESIDEGLENSKRIIIKNAANDPTILTKHTFDEDFFVIQEIPRNHALNIKDQYSDAEIYMQDKDDDEKELEPVRILKTAFEMNGHFYELKVANSMIEEDDLIEELLWNVIWLYITLILSILFINHFIQKKLWKPFYNFLSQLKSYQLGKSTQLPVVTTKTKEFIDLKMAVNTLLEHSISVFEQQKEFVGNASHELQTPLAITTNKLELLIEKGSLNEPQAKTVTEVYETIQRMIQFNKSLLLLSKIDNKEFFENQEIDINQMIHDVVHDLEEFIHYKNIHIEIEEEKQLNTTIDPTLGRFIVSNLLKNAIFHSNKGSSIQVFISEYSLCVANSGEKKLDSSKLFKRFQAASSKTSQTGLGLAIVKAITDLYNYRVSYNYKDEKHIFEVHFNFN